MLEPYKLIMVHATRFQFVSITPSGHFNPADMDFLIDVGKSRDDRFICERAVLSYEDIKKFCEILTEIVEMVEEAKKKKKKEEENG